VSSPAPTAHTSRSRAATLQALFVIEAALLVHRVLAGQQHPRQQHPGRRPCALGDLRPWACRVLPFRASMRSVASRHWLPGGVALAIGVLGCGQDFDALFIESGVAAEGGGGQGPLCVDGGLGSTTCGVSCPGGSCACSSSSSADCTLTCTKGPCIGRCSLPSGCSMACPVGETCTLTCSFFGEGQVNPQTCPLSCVDGTTATPCNEKALLCGTRTPQLCPN